MCFLTNIGKNAEVGFARTCCLHVSAPTTMEHSIPQLSLKMMMTPTTLPRDSASRRNAAICIEETGFSVPAVIAKMKTKIRERTFIPEAMLLFGS